MPTYFPDLYRGVGMTCEQIPDSAYFPTLEKTGRKVIDVLKWIEDL